MLTILVVEDDEMVVEATASILKRRGYSVITVSCGEDAVAKALEIKPDLILMDIQLSSGISGIETAKQIHLKQKIPIIYMSAYKDQLTLDNAQATGPFDYLVKPFHKKELIGAIKVALYKSVLTQNKESK